MACALKDLRKVLRALPRNPVHTCIFAVLLFKTSYRSLLQNSVLMHDHVCRQSILDLHVLFICSQEILLLVAMHFCYPLLVTEIVSVI